MRNDRSYLYQEMDLEIAIGMEIDKGNVQRAEQLKNKLQELRKYINGVTYNQ